MALIAGPLRLVDTAMRSVDSISFSSHGVSFHGSHFKFIPQNKDSFQKVKIMRVMLSIRQ